MTGRGKFNGKAKALSILKANPGVRITSRQIAQLVFEKYKEDCESKRSRSDVINTDEELVGQISAEFGSYWRTIVDENPKIQFLETRPRQFYFERSDSYNKEETIPKASFHAESSLKSKALSEHDLYPILGGVVFNEMRCYSMRIDERAGSNNRGPKGNHWLYPDVVGMIPLSEKWGKEVSVLAETLATERVHLVSFEVKKEIRRSDVREFFFQTVSNSTWANYAYLAATDLKGGDATEELTLLCSSYGVGFILIDIADPSNSQIRIPARLKENIDVNGLNRLASENPDAKEFIENVSTFIKTSRLKKSDWDLIPLEE